MGQTVRNVWIDTGGTFTDCVAVDDAGTFRREKVLSSSALRGSIETVIGPKRLRISAAWRSAPENFIAGFEFRLLGTDHARAVVNSFDPTKATVTLDREVLSAAAAGAAFEVHSPEEAPTLAARLVTGTPSGSPLPPMSMRLATTRGTNALLERRGARTALFITKGFGDLLLIGDQQRPDLFALDIRKPQPLYESVVEVPERIDADGTVAQPIRIEAIGDEVSRLSESGVRCAAVVLAHSYVNPSHEMMVAEFLRANGFEHVSCSTALAPFIKIVPRAQTTVVNAYLSPVIDDYITRVQAPLFATRQHSDYTADREEIGRLHVMTSAGGMAQPSSYHAKDSLLSGPAGGVVGAVRAARLSGFETIIAFDMGGTSTDVARYQGDYDYVFEHQVGDAHLVAPALAIESVAAGGGSICGFDGAELFVGPRSAGAAPGPACYGAGGPLTLTDVNLLLGRLDETRFDIPIDADAADRACTELIGTVEHRTKQRQVREKLLEGFCEIANERMADAIRRISIRKGYDPADHALVAFGGAGAQHACAVAALLGIETIVIPKDVSLLSALGIGSAAIERFAERQVLAQLDAVRADVARWIDELAGQAGAILVAEGVEESTIEIRRRIVNLRFVGQDSVLQVEYDEGSPLEEAFESKYRFIFGHWQKDRAIEIESIRVVASSQTHDADVDRRPTPPDDTIVAPAPRSQRAWFAGNWREVPAYERSQLPRGGVLDGPALVFERYSVTVVDAGWTAEVDDGDALILRRSDEPAAPAESGQTARPELVRLELFTNRFGSIAREMGEMLRRTAISTNVKERLDFSCALLDRNGELIVNAPHIPVHLGALGMCVRSLRETIAMAPGDVVVTNHPRFGGSHLPDVTVVTPVFLPDDRLLGYVANRAHHAEIGGSRPGSMPPDASNLSEEGVVIPPTLLFHKNEARWDDVRRILTGAPNPTRALEENLADLRAAVAANRNGVAALLALAEDHGAETVWHFMDALHARAKLKLGEALRSIPDGVYRAEEYLDDGTPLQVGIHITGDRASIDFSGSAGVHPGNLNATPAVTGGAVIYVLRLLVDEPLPLNEGLMHAVSLRIPDGILNPPFPDDPAESPAVVGGNVETSQRLVDTMLKALGLVACSQGTMNNVLFGTDRYSYYETVCGGAGAGPGFHGASAVHTHMTNTRITDLEILEHRYPVKVNRFSIRSGSGGGGRHAGGLGVVREISFLDDMDVSVLCQHRSEGPYGLAGGERGRPGNQYIVRDGGDIENLGSVDGRHVRPGDRLVLETPGGGGYGSDTHEHAPDSTENDTAKHNRSK
jgi:5-oxoprolinase (ATP-hydrolysing)